VAVAGVVVERGRVAEERRHGRRYGTGASWTTPSAPTSLWSAPARPACTPRSWPPPRARAWSS
jgi:hypothetical protein